MDTKTHEESYKLIVIEGTDSSGKGTQSKLLAESLEEAGHKVKLISFPNYGSKSAKSIEAYLRGEKPLLNPYDVAKLYADDRYATFRIDLDNPDFDFLIVDRYVGSNFIHQCSKIDGLKNRKRFIYEFLRYEYRTLGLPIPDLEIFLDMPREFADELMDARGRSDIHENDKPYLERCYQTAKWVADYLSWETVRCIDPSIGGGEPDTLREVEEIHRDICNLLVNEELIAYR